MSDHFSNLQYAKARLALISAESTSTELCQTLQAAGYEICFDDVPSQGKIHLLIVDLRASSDPFDFANTRVLAERQHAANCGVIFIASISLSTEVRAGLAPLGEVVICPTPLTLLSVVSQKLRYRALAEETALRLCSLRQSNAPKTLTDACTPPEIAEPSGILLAGSPSPTILATASALRMAGHRFECVFSAGQALRAVLARRFDAAVFVPSSDHDPLFALSRHFLRSRRRSLPPVIFVGYADRVVKRCYVEAVDTVNLESELAHRVQKTIKEAKVRLALKNIFSMRQYPAIRHIDRETYNLAFCAHHTSRLFRASDVQKFPISLIALRLIPSAKTTSLSEVIRTITLSVRIMDLTCAISADTILIISRGLTYRDAPNVSRRLEGLFSNDNRSGYKARLAVGGVATQNPGERFEETLARALILTRSENEHFASIR